MKEADFSTVLPDVEKGPAATSIDKSLCNSAGASVDVAVVAVADFVEAVTILVARNDFPVGFVP